MPSAQEIARKQNRQVDTVETAGLGPIMSRCATDQRLTEEQQSGNRHEFDRRALRIGRDQRGGVRWRPIAAVPAEVGEPAEGQQYERRAAKQENQADGAVEDGSCRRIVPRERVIREVAGVGIGLAGPLSH